MKGLMIVLFLALSAVTVRADIPSREFSIADCGAREGELATRAIAAAMKACTEAGGGRVVVPKGTWLTGAVRLASNCELHLANCATLEFSDDPADYPEVDTTWEGKEMRRLSPLVYGEGVTNVAITGQGVLSARLAGWSRRYQRKESRPHFIQFNRCRDISLRDFKISGSPAWMIHLYRSADCRIEGLDCRAIGRNNDGVDVEMSKNVVIERCRFDQGDDGVCLKSGKDADGRRIGVPTENVVVRACEFGNCHGMLAIGSELSGGIRNVRCSDCRVRRCGAVVRIKTTPTRGGFVENVSVSDCRGEWADRVFDIMADYGKNPGDASLGTFHTPIRNVSISGVYVEACDYAYRLHCDRDCPPQGLVLENIRVGRRKLPTDEIWNFPGFADGRPSAGVKEELEKPFLPAGADVSSWASVYRRVDELDAQADRAWQRLKTREEYDAYRKAMHAKMVEAIGGFPERTPLNARTVATFRREGYVIEKVMFESMPGLVVSANLFIPDRPEFKPPYAAVVMSCGHAQREGKDSATYQRACVHVANRGMVAFMFDPYEQGERCQYCGKDGNCCQQHNLIGLKAMLLGWSMPMLRLWDGIRAVDYVEMRPEVDGNRIGYMGQSGGGTMSALMTAVDWRLKATAPSCYLTSLGYLCKFKGPQDAEQNIFGQLAFGLNHTGYVLLPDTKVCVTGRFSDMFPWGGAAQLSRTVSDVAAMLGEAGNYGLNFSPGPHGWTESTMAASADWMAAWLKGEKSLLPLDMPNYRAMDIGYSVARVDCGIPFGESRVTPEYSTTKVTGSRDIHAILRDRLSAARAKRVRRTADETSSLVRRLAAIRDPSEAKVKVRTVESSVENGVSVTRLAFMYPDGLALPAVLLEVANADAAKPPVLMVGAAGRGEFADEVSGRLARGERILVADVTGTGDIGKDPHVFYGAKDTPEEGTAVMLYLMGESMVGRRASDILLLADWLKRRFGAPANLVAKGSVAIAAAHAFAAARSAFVGITVSETPLSWTEIVEHPGAPLANRYAWCVNGALLEYDWTDLLEQGMPPIEQQ